MRDKEEVKKMVAMTISFTKLSLCHYSTHHKICMCGYKLPFFFGQNFRELLWKREKFIIHKIRQKKRNFFFSVVSGGC
jgi:hypothetical protein